MTSHYWLLSLVDGRSCGASQMVFFSWLFLADYLVWDDPKKNG